MVIKGAPKGVKPVLPAVTPVVKPAPVPVNPPKKERRTRKPAPSKQVEIVEVSTETVNPKEGI